MDVFEYVFNDPLYPISDLYLKKCEIFDIIYIHKEQSRCSMDVSEYVFNDPLYPISDLYLKRCEIFDIIYIHKEQSTMLNLCF
jgi:hypothetical protein